MKEKGDNILAKIILLTLGVCSDLLASSIAYGAGKIKISFQSAFLVSLVGTAALWAALCLSESPLILINTDVAKAVGGWVLIAFGIFMIFQKPIAGLYKRFISKGKKESLMMSVILDEKKADSDNSKELSLKEAFVLGLALSPDSFVTGFSAGVGFSPSQKGIAAAAAFITGLSFICAGEKAGRMLSLKINTRLDLSVLGGGFILALGICQLAF